MKFRKLMFVCTLFVYPAIAVAEEIVVVTANREENAVKKVASSVAVHPQNVVLKHHSRTNPDQ